MDKIYTTLKQIRSHSPCEDGYKKLVKSLGGLSYGEDAPITFKQIYESNGYDDTLWCLRTVDGKWFPLWRHFACDAADDVRHLMIDDRSLNAIDVARRFADGLATEEELTAARAAAGDVAWADAGDAAGDVAWAAAGAAAWAAQMQRLFKYCETGERVMGEIK